MIMSGDTDISEMEMHRDGYRRSQKKRAYSRWRHRYQRDANAQMLMQRGLRDMSIVMGGTVISEMEMRQVYCDGDTGTDATGLRVGEQRFTNRAI